METICDWEVAERHLSEIESAYTKIGSAGYLALNMFIRPCRDRLNKGERTKELFDAIMALQ
jgi:hypothetical protein